MIYVPFESLPEDSAPQAASASSNQATLGGFRLGWRPSGAAMEAAGDNDDDNNNSNNNNNGAHYGHS